MLVGNGSASLAMLVYSENLSFVAICFEDYVYEYRFKKLYDLGQSFCPHLCLFVNNSNTRRVKFCVEKYFVILIHECVLKIHTVTAGLEEERKPGTCVLFCT